MSASLAAWSSLSRRPACTSSVSADTLSASESSLRTRTEGWCTPRSTWLRYGCESVVISASWRRESWASSRWLRMNAPSASVVWAVHGSLITHLRPPNIADAQPGARRPVPARSPRTAFQPVGGFYALLLRRGRLPSWRRSLAAHHGDSDLDHVLGELSLRGQQLSGEVIGIRDQLAWLRQLVGERHCGDWQRRRHRMDGRGPDPERVDHGLLAHADRVEGLRLQLLGGGTGIGHWTLLI